MIRIVPIFFPVILVGLGVLTILLIALSKAGRAGRWILIGIGLFLLLLMLLFALIMPVLAHRSRIEYATKLPAVVETPVSMEDNVIWQDNLEKELVPDNYSNIQRAAYGLGTQLRETIEEAMDQPPSEILILESSSLSKSILNEFRDGLKSQYEQANIYFGQRPAGDFPVGMICIMVNSSEEAKHQITVPTGSDTSLIFMSGNAGKLEATVETGKGKYYKGVSYDYRPWLWDRQVFLSNAPNKNWMVVASDETATSRQGARYQAMNQAAAAVFHRIQDTHLPLRRNFILKHEFIEQHGLIVEEYSQKLQGMAGPIWRYAVLLDVSPQRLQSLIFAKTEVVRVQRKTWLRLFVSLGGMILLVCVVYAIANAATKGYYSMVLAVSAVTAAVILGLIILNYA